MSKSRIVLAIVAIIGLWLIVAASSWLRPPQDELIGTWVIESAEALGNKSPADQAGRMKIEIHPDKAKWHFRQGDGWRAWYGTLWRDPKADPKQIDLSQPDNPKTVAHGIYKIEGGLLTISAGAVRPTTFEEPSVMRLVFQRE